MNANELACEVPLVEMLEGVPKDARFVQEKEFSSTYYPVGRICHEAATMLRQQHTSLISDVDVIERQYKEIQVKDEAIFNSQKQAYNLAMQVQNQKALIKQLEETQVYLYKTHDADKAEIEALKVSNQALKILNDGKNKIIEEYEHKYPDFFFMEHDILGER